MSAPVVCANITPAGERRRRLGAYAAIAAGLIVAAGLAWRDASPSAWLVLFPFALVAAFDLLQVRAKTCVIHGFRGTEEVAGGGVRRVRDEAMQAQARRQAISVLWKSVAVAVLVTLAAVLASGLSVELVS